MILRFRTSLGTYRVQVDETDDFVCAKDQLSKQLPPHDPQSITISDSPSGKGRPIHQLCGRSIARLGLKHGDLLFVGLGELPRKEENEQKETKVTQAPVQQLEIDDELDKEEGKIVRPRDQRMCKHGDQGMCDYCMPLEPYDSKYQVEQGIKNLSFHAYLKEQNATLNKNQGSSQIAPLSEPFMGVLPSCPAGHPPWPDGICSTCQPSAITLSPQHFRMVDHVEFAHPQVIDSFINAWRLSGSQRFGYMFGKYAKYPSVPLGIKAVVEVIYEPPQSDESDGFALQFPWEEEKEIHSLAEKCGMTCVGMIFTDLADAGKGDGSVLCKRHPQSYFLSSLEVIFAAKLQRMNPNVCRWSESRRYSSKFVTCVVSGNDTQEIDISSFQVSVAAEALVDAELVEASTNPACMRVKPATNLRYVPEIFYKRTNQYDIAVREKADSSFPVDYLLVTLTHGFPADPSPMFISTSFPHHHRGHIGAIPDLAALSKQLNPGSYSDSIPVDSLSDFQLLVYVKSLGVLNEEEFEFLCKAAVEHEPQDAYLLCHTPGWKTLQAILTT